MLAAPALHSAGSASNGIQSRFAGPFPHSFLLLGSPVPAAASKEGAAPAGTDAGDASAPTGKSKPTELPEAPAALPAATYFLFMPADRANCPSVKGAPG